MFTEFTKEERTFLQTIQHNLVQLVSNYISKDHYDHYSSRIKEPSSIISKMNRTCEEYDTQKVLETLNDIIGIRVITQYIKDIYLIADQIREHFNVVEEQDYIANPKSSGYRSYHMTIRISLYNTPFEFHPEYLDVELQLRTLGMDFWASLEHSLVYSPQKTHPKTTSHSKALIHNELLSYADSIFSIDMRIQALQQLDAKEQAK